MATSSCGRLVGLEANIKKHRLDLKSFMICGIMFAGLLELVIS